MDANRTSSSKADKKSSSQERLQMPTPTIQITDAQDGATPRSATKNKDLPLPRRLSKLFYPMNKEELEKETISSKDDESVGLLSGALSSSSRDIRETLKVPFAQQRRNSEDIRRSWRSSSTDGGLNASRLEILKKIEDGTQNRDDSSEHSSSSGSSDSHSEGEDEDDNKDYTSWDDTICSNRSAYFKLYYQRNLAALNSKEDSKSRASTRASSYTSLASLIREKNKMKTPTKDKKARREEVGLMVLVVFLFLVLVIGISLIYYFYHQHLEELSLFKRLKFNEEERLLELFSDSKGKLVVLSKLGLTLPRYSKAEDCTEYLKCIQLKEREFDLETDIELTANVSLQDFESINEFEFDNETVCLDWANQARVQIHKAPSREKVSCYNVYWSAHHPGALKDCVVMSGEDLGVWWGIGEISGGGFPLKIANIAPSIYETQQLGKGSWGQLIRRSFISSLGAIVTLPNHLPAIISVENNTQLCISVNASHHKDSMVHTTLNYTICSSPGVHTALDYLHHLAAGGIYNPLTKEKIEPPPLPHDEDRRKRILRRIESPVWIPYLELNDPILTQDGVLKYAEQIKTEIGSEGGCILLPLSWQSKQGEFTFDPVRFPDPEAMTKALKQKGLHVAVTLAPVISSETEAFNNGTRDGMWVQQMGSSLPVLIPYEGVIAGALVDFTNPRSSDWFVTKVKILKDRYGIENFHLALPDSNIIPRYHQFHNGVPNPDLAIGPYVKSVYSVDPPLSTEAAIIPPAPPTFVSIGSEESGWESLSSMIPRILTLSLLGYPLIDAGIVGGKPDRPGNIPEKELFIRWVEAAAFLPAFQINALPELFDEDTQSIVRVFMQKREELALPRFRETVKNIFLNSTPLISPLGLLFPEDTTAAAVGDEWIIGHDLLIAPVLHRGKTTRDVYIPDGIWESQSDKSIKQGPGWIKNYKVPLTEVAYFIKKKVI